MFPKTEIITHCRGNRLIKTMAEGSLEGAKKRSQNTEKIINYPKENEELSRS